MIKFTLVVPDSGDWEALYADGRLIAEGHRLDARDVLDAISDMLPNKLAYKWVSDEVAEMGMPEKLSELEE